MQRHGRASRASPRNSTSCSTRYSTRSRTHQCHRSSAKGLPASAGRRDGPRWYSSPTMPRNGARPNRSESDPRPHRNFSRRPQGHDSLPQGILTARGGMTSHAAVVARGMGKCCVSGAGELEIDYKNRTIKVDGTKPYKEGDWISLNGSTGEVYEGQVATMDAEAERRLRPTDGTGRQICRAPEGPRERRHAARCENRHSASARRASASAAPNTCSSRATASRPSAR